MMYRPKKCKSCGMMQKGGVPNQKDYPDYESWQAAMDDYMKSMSTQQDPYKIDISSANAFTNDFLPETYASSPKANLNPVQEAINNGLIEDHYKESFMGTSGKPQPKKDPYKTLMNVGIAMRGTRAGLGFLSGAIERGRQNQYDYTQQTALGQMNPMPSTDFQPNPYSLYAKYGGNLKNIVKDHNKWSNNATMSMGVSQVPKAGTKDTQLKFDRMLIMRRIFPEMFKKMEEGGEFKKGGIHIKKENKGKFTDYCNGNVTSDCIERGLNSPSATIRKRANFARNARKWNDKMGGLTANKARTILHDKKVHGHELTDKQRRFFGAMSKGHTNFRGK